jgi:hypothetical protein
MLLYATSYRGPGILHIPKVLYLAKVKVSMHEQKTARSSGQLSS